MQVMAFSDTLSKVMCLRVEKASPSGFKQSSRPVTRLPIIFVAAKHHEFQSQGANCISMFSNIRIRRMTSVLDITRESARLRK